MKNDIIVMAHGGGGMLTRKLIDELLVVELDNPILATLDDGACLSVPEQDLVMTTDSYVVEPLFFPGGDIGKLAVCGTINDLAMQGAEPRYLSLGLILEEGLPIRSLEKIIKSLAQACRDVGVSVVTGDTKVVQHHGRAGKPSGMFINTTGLGVRVPNVNVSVSNASPGDAVIITGPIGDHGIAVMNAREKLRLESGLISDVAPLWGMTRSLLEAVPALQCLRDPTRGGCAASLCDIALASSCSIRIRERDLPVRDEVSGACSLLGLDPLEVANEGKALVVCPGAKAELAITTLRGTPAGAEARIIGEIVEGPSGLVILETRAGGERVVTIPLGESLPRIC